VRLPTKHRQVLAEHYSRFDVLANMRHSRSFGKGEQSSALSTRGMTTRADILMPSSIRRMSPFHIAKHALITTAPLRWQM
jgi:hypothetical protein